MIQRVSLHFMLSGNSQLKKLGRKPQVLCRDVPKNSWNMSKHMSWLMLYISFGIHPCMSQSCESNPNPPEGGQNYISKIQKQDAFSFKTHSQVQ